MLLPSGADRSGTCDRKRLGMDVQLRMTAWNLRQRELKLIELGDALQVCAPSLASSLSLFSIV